MMKKKNEEALCVKKIIFEMLTTLKGMKLGRQFS